MEQLLSDAKQLVQRLHHHDNAADALISDATNLEAKLLAMKEYREEVTKLNEISKHRPRSTLILGSQLENQRIQDLENENRELHYSLSEHQSALELIMNKYREQVLNLLSHRGLDKNALEQMNKNSLDVNVLTEKIIEMAAVMQKAVRIDENLESCEAETAAKLRFENKALRELLLISGHPKKEIEKLRMKELLEEQKMLVNGHKPLNKSLEHDSSIEEFEHETGTVRRRIKVKVENGVDDSKVTDRADNQATDVQVDHEKNNPAKLSDGCQDEQKSSEDNSTVQNDIIEDLAEHNEESSPAVQLKSSEVLGSSEANDINSDEAVSELNPAESEEGKRNDDEMSVESNKTTVDGACNEKIELNAEVSKSEPCIAESDHVMPSQSLNENSNNILTAETSGTNNDNPLELYNSEGRLLENVEDIYALQGRGGKASGIKIRKSNKHKKIIQAGLKSFFANEANQDCPDGSKVEQVDEEIEEQSVNRCLDSSTGSEDSGIKILSKNTDVCEESLNPAEPSDSTCRDSSTDETKDHDQNQNQKCTSVKSDIDGKGEGTDTLEVDVGSALPDTGDVSQPKHKTIELDFSDSDSEDTDVMIEDQFAGISDEDSDTDSDSDDSDDKGDEHDDVLQTEMELIGDLNEGGEVVVSRWEREEEGYAHLKDSWKEQDGDEGEDNKAGSSGPIQQSTGEKDQADEGERSEQNDFSFMQAALQLDQFTGGSIKAKFAKRKSYENADKANAVKLSSEMLSKEVASKENLSASSSAENNSPEREQLDANEPATVDVPILTLNSDEMLDVSSSDSSSCPSKDDLQIGNKEHASATSSGSSSGEIDPTGTERNVAADSPKVRRQSDCAQHLTELLSDLDAALAISDNEDVSE